MGNCHFSLFQSPTQYLSVARYHDLILNFPPFTDSLNKQHTDHKSRLIPLLAQHPAKIITAIEQDLLKRLVSQAGNIISYLRHI